MKIVSRLDFEVSHLRLSVGVLSMVGSGLVNRQVPVAPVDVRALTGHPDKVRNHSKRKVILFYIYSICKLIKSLL